MDQWTPFGESGCGACRSNYPQKKCKGLLPYTGNLACDADTIARNKLQHQLEDTGEYLPIWGLLVVLSAMVEIGGVGVRQFLLKPKVDWFLAKLSR